MDVIDPKKGDIFLADFSIGSGREVKPVLIVQNDLSNRYMDTTIVVEMPDFISKKLLPTHVNIPAKASNLGRDAVAMAEHLTTIKKERLKKFVARVPDKYMREIDGALKVSLALD